MGEFDGSEQRRRDAEVMAFMQQLRATGAVVVSEVQANDGTPSAGDLAAVDEAVALHRWATWPAPVVGE